MRYSDVVLIQMIEAVNQAMKDLADYDLKPKIEGMRDMQAYWFNEMELKMHALEWFAKNNYKKENE